MQKETKVKIQFGGSPQSAPMPAKSEEVLEKDSEYDNQILDELIKIKDALRRGDVESAMRLVDQCIQRQEADIEGPKQKDEPDLNAMLGKLKGGPDSSNPGKFKEMAEKRFAKFAHER